MFNCKTLGWVLITMAMVGFADAADAATYNWTGAIDGDWNKNGNWAGGTAPVAATDPNSFSIGGNLSFPRGVSNRLVFDANVATLPTSNIPTFGGGNNTNGATPQVDLLNGTMTFTKDGGEFWNQNTAINFATVGDGDTGNGSASLTYVGTTKFARSSTTTNGAHTFIVNADGTLNFDTPGGTFDWADGATRPAEMILNGGSINIDAHIFDNDSPGVNHLVDLTAAGSAFTANFGGSYADLTAVQADLGAGKFFQSSTALTLQAVDNVDGSFTVSTAPVPEPASLAMGLVGLGLVAMRRRKV